MYPLQQAYGLTTTNFQLGSTAVPSGASASFISDTLGVVGWRIYPHTAATLFIGAASVTNGLTMAAVGAVVPGGGTEATELWGPVRFNLAAGAAAVNVSVSKLLSEGFVAGSSQSPGL